MARIVFLGHGSSDPSSSADTAMVLVPLNTLVKHKIPLAGRPGSGVKATIREVT